MKNSKLVVAGAAALTPLLAFGQQQDRVGLEEIIVTAQRRVESIQDVPISVSVFSAEDLERANVTQAKNYLQFSPNVSFTEDGQVGNRAINISIRGVGDVGLSEVVTANSVGYYIDEFNVGTVANGIINPQLSDVERIEVLRGPQGTYFGRNALAGALNITTKKPEQAFYAEASARLERFNTWATGGVLNVPMSDAIAMRLVADYSESDGIIENVNPEGTEDSGYEEKNLRVAFRATPSEDATIDLSLSYTDEQNGFDSDTNSGVLDLDTQDIFGRDFEAIDDQVGFYPHNQSKANHNAPERNDVEYTIGNLRFAYQFGGFELRSITGYIDSSIDRLFDQDVISADALVRENHFDGESYSQELRLQSTGERTWTWTIGGLYAHDEITQFNSIRAGSEGSYTNPVTGEVIGLLPPIPAGFRINENDRIFETTSYALFADVGWHLNDRWTLTLGARFTRDEIDNRLFNVVNFEGPPLAGAGSDTFTDVSPRVVLTFEPSANLTWYASASKGYKAGGVDVLFVPSESDPDVQVPLLSSFDPEEMRNYEIGMKALLADGRARLSASVFYLDWQDMQVQTSYLRDPNDISSSVETTLNASAASTKGAEVELIAQLTDNWQFGFGAGYLDGKFEEFPNAVLSGANSLDMSDARLPKAPKLTASAFTQYEFDIASSFEPFVRAEWIHRDESAGDLEGAVALSGREIESGQNAGEVLPHYPYVIPSYDVVNLRVGFGTDAWDVQAYVENLLDEDYYNGTGDNFGLGGIRLRPHPQVYGIKFILRTR